MGSAVQLRAIKRRRLRKRLTFSLVFLGLTSAIGAKPGYDHLRAASLLTRVAQPENHTWVADFQRHGVDVSLTQMETSVGPVRAKVYVPREAPNPPALVIIHGVHHLGIDEPRLMAFANALCSSGVLVFTPQVDSLADYTIEPSAVTIIGESVHQLSQRAGAPRVGLVGLSFAGGLALTAASDPRYSPNIAYTVAVGGHHDLGRVLRFYASDEIETTGRVMVRAKAHEYGLLVAAYSHIADFFQPEDQANAREALRQLLHEDVEASKAAASKLSPDGIETMNLLYAQSKASVGPVILDRLPLYESDVMRVSPRGKLGTITAPVYLLQGAGDNVIPPSETEWIASEVPPRYLAQSLVSPAISHVEVGGQPTFEDKARLLHWLAEFVSEAHNAPESTKTIAPASVTTTKQ
jgi:pimeloyl-ACP methyl ester carboxylesterase